MPSVPVPVFTLAILLMLLAKVSLSGSGHYRRATMFLAGCALLVIISALRWSFDFQALTPAAIAGGHRPAAARLALF
ncbi:hypothetical protein ACLF4G_004197 [Cronobacter sakazakii]